MTLSSSLYNLHRSFIHRRASFISLSLTEEPLLDSISEDLGSLNQDSGISSRSIFVPNNEYDTESRHSQDQTLLYIIFSILGLGFIALFVIFLSIPHQTVFDTPILD